MRTTSPKRVALTGAITTLTVAAATLALAGTPLAQATPPNGETVTPLARGELVADANVNRQVDAGRVRIHTHGNLDALTVKSTIAPGGDGGWHSHAGPHISVVQQGTLTIIDSNCNRHDVNAGQAVIDSGADVEKVENLGTTPAVVIVTLLIPHDATSPRIDAPAPDGCNA